MTMDLQWCRACGAAQYPSRDACRVCLSDELEMRATVLFGTLRAKVTIQRSLDPAMLANGPLDLGVIATPLGVRVLALLAPDVRTGMQVTIAPHPMGSGALLASAASDVPSALPFLSTPASPDHA